MRWLNFALVSFVFLPAAWGADPSPRKSIADLPVVKELPNPFLFQDGSPVRDAKDWERRRIELKQLFQDYMYGHLPAKPKMTITKRDRILDAENAVSILPLELTLENQGKQMSMKVLVATPEKSKGPFPVLVQSGFSFARPGAPAPAPGRRFAAFTRRGYAVAELSFPEVAIDNKDRGRSAGIYKLFDDKIDCGALMAWAWGMHRTIDALETLDFIDIKKVIVTGHSRYGKAALVAGAFDERIALTVPSHSGCGGSAPYRYIFGKSEQLHNIVGAFPHWFRPDFNQFVGKVEQLPVDQHLLLSLVAPRGLLQPEGTQDSWTNPEGVQLTYLAASKVYALLGAEKKLSIRYRPVGHIPSNEDLLDFADHLFFQKPLSSDFGKFAYPEASSAMPWAKKE